MLYQVFEYFATSFLFLGGLDCPRFLIPLVWVCH